MDRIEDLVLMGANVSTADREAWWRWMNNSSSSSGAKRKKKKRRKRKLPKVGGRAVLGQVGCRARCCATTRLGEPVVCQRHRTMDAGGGDSACACLRGADRGVPMPQIMEVFVVPPIMEEIMEVIQLGTKLLTCSLLRNEKCLGRQSRKLRRFRSSALLGSSSSWTRLLTRPLVCNVRCLGPDCAENRGVSADTALGRVCPGSAGQVFRALDYKEFFVIEGSLGVALTLEVELPGVRPPVVATISG